MGSQYLAMRFWVFYPENKKKLRKINCYLDKGRNQKASITEGLPYNPLLNFVILEKVLPHIARDIKNLLQLRLVCSEWNYEISKMLSRKSTPTYLKFQTESEYADLTKLLAKSNKQFWIQSFYIKLPQLSSNYLKILSSSSIQMSIVNLKIVVSSSDFPMMLKYLHNLTNLKSLVVLRKLEGSLESLRTSDTLNEGSNLLLPQLANLENICLRNLTIAKTLFMLFHNNFTQSVISFLNSVPNLKSLEFCNWSGKLIQILKESKVSKSLQVLVIRGRTVGDDDMKWLTSIKFPNLRRVELSIDRNVGESVIQEFINSVKDTIQEYNIVQNV